VGAELRYQRWLSTPAFVETPGGAARRDTLTIAAGPHLHLMLSETITLRPGFAYARGLDAPLAAADYRIVQIDFPVAF
jgi:hypothetical protein